MTDPGARMSGNSVTLSGLWAVIWPRAGETGPKAARDTPFTDVNDQNVQSVFSKKESRNACMACMACLASTVGVGTEAKPGNMTTS